MSVGIYFLRVFKYLLKMAILLGVVFALMTATNASELSIEELKANMFDPTKGSLFMFALLAVALTYPKFGYAKRTIQLDFSSKRDSIISVMEKTGYSLYIEESDKMIFRATSPLKRVIMLGDDKISLYKCDNSIKIDGVRKDISFAEYRLKALIEQD